MDNLKPLLIDRLKSKSMDPALIPRYLKALATLFSTDPGIDADRANRKLQALGWNEVAIYYHSLQIALACLLQEKG